MQFYCPSLTYLAIPYLHYFSIFRAQCVLRAPGEQVVELLLLSHAYIASAVGILSYANTKLFLIQKNGMANSLKCIFNIVEEVRETRMKFHKKSFRFIPNTTIEVLEDDNPMR